MTFVAAKRFGDRILILGDTMVSDLTGTRHDVIPGQLKIVVISTTLTIAFAGLVHQALDAIRMARRYHISGSPPAEIEQKLANATALYEGQIEFLVASHSAGQPTLRRIWDGLISDDLPYVCIGKREIQKKLFEYKIDFTKNVTRKLGPHSDEHHFVDAFHTLFSGVYIDDGVGGFPIFATCSPYGHCYNSTAIMSAWDPVLFNVPSTDQQLADRASGMTQWSFNVQAPKRRGAAVLGAAVVDAGVGYIYSPLESDDPIKWNFKRPNAQSEVGEILSKLSLDVERWAEILGGILVE